MKQKILFALLGVFIMGGIAEAKSGRFGGIMPYAWRSSFTETNEREVLIASGAIMLNGIKISTPGGGWGVYFLDTQLFENDPVTRTYISASSSETDHTGYNMYFSSGLMYTKQGEPVITILWDWINKPALAPKPGPK